MSFSLTRTVRFGLLLIAGFALGILAMTFVSGEAKGGVWSKIGVASASAKSPVVADASCTLPSKDAGQEVYFVSCGGFF